MERDGRGSRLTGLRRTRGGRTDPGRGGRARREEGSLRSPRGGRRRVGTAGGGRRGAPGFGSELRRSGEGLGVQPGPTRVGGSARFGHHGLKADSGSGCARPWRAGEGAEDRRVLGEPPEPAPSGKDRAARWLRLLRGGQAPRLGKRRRAARMPSAAQAGAVCGHPRSSLPGRSDRFPEECQNREGQEAAHGRVLL